LHHFRHWHLAITTSRLNWPANTGSFYNWLYFSCSVDTKQTKALSRFNSKTEMVDCQKLVVSLGQTPKKLKLNLLQKLANIFS
jgi:hypothetical protein